MKSLKIALAAALAIIATSSVSATQFDVVQDSTTSRDYKGRVLTAEQAQYYNGQSVGEVVAEAGKSVDAQGNLVDENGKSLGKLPKDGNSYGRSHGNVVMGTTESKGYKAYTPAKGSGAAVYQFVAGKK